MKKKIMNALVENENIVAALDVPEIEDPYDLIYTHIYPFLYMPDIQEKAKVYITMKLETTKIFSNDRFKNAILTLCVVSHRDKMKTEWNSTRTDLIAGLLIDEFNWKDLLGFEMELSSDIESPLDNTYYVRQVVFESTVKNYAGCK